MFCTKCGNRYQEDSGFCTNCGNAKEGASGPTAEQASFTPVDPPAAPPSESYHYAPGMPNAPYSGGTPAVALKKKKSPIIPIAIVAALVAAIAIAVVLWVIPLIGLAPLMPAQRAFANFNDEVSQRIAGSPFQSLVIMDEILQDGVSTLTLDFDYRSGNMWDPDVSGTISFATDTEAFENAIFGEFRVMGLPIDITAVMNRERIAVQSNVIDRDNFYGITFATFPRDMMQFGSLIGMSTWEINQIIDAVEMIEEALNVDTDLDDLEDAFADLFIRFFADVEISTENTEIRVGAENVSVNRVGFILTEHEIINLLHEMVDIIENDPAVRSAFGANNPMMMDMGMPSFNEMMREIRTGLREFEREFEGSIEFAAYIGSGDRLMQARMTADMSFEDDRATFGALLNMGTSVNDTWELSVDWSDRWTSDSFTISWDFRQIGQNYENSISFFDGRDYITLASTWNPNNGRFDLSFHDGWQTHGFGGSFNIANDGGFNLQLDRIDMGWSGDTLDLGMTLSPGADIPRVDFINMDRWDWSLIEMIERSILGMLW